MSGIKRHKCQIKLIMHFVGAEVSGNKEKDWRREMQVETCYILFALPLTKYSLKLSIRYQLTAKVTEHNTLNKIKYNGRAPNPNG